MTRKIDLTTEAVVLRPSDSALPLTVEALDAGDDADDERHERRLDHADREVSAVEIASRSRARKMSGVMPP